MSASILAALGAGLIAVWLVLRMVRNEQAQPLPPDPFRWERWRKSSKPAANADHQPLSDNTTKDGA